MFRQRRQIDIYDLYLDGSTIQNAIDELTEHLNNVNVIPKDSPLYSGEPHIDIGESYGCISVKLVQNVYTETEEEFKLRKLYAHTKKGDEITQLKRRLRELGEAL